MKPSEYPPFRCRCIVNVQIPGDKSRSISVRVCFYITHRDEIHNNAKREVIWALERLGVPHDTLKDADFETDDHDFIALEPKGVKRRYGTRVEAFYFHDPKKRDLLIRQRRLVPESHHEMMEMYGKPTKSTTQEATA